MPDSTQGLAGRSDHRARLRRDVALDRVGSITRKIVIGSIAGAAAIGFYVSRALPGHSARPASSGVAGSTPGTGGHFGRHRPRIGRHRGVVDRRRRLSQHPDPTDQSPEPDPATGARGERFHVSGRSTGTRHPPAPAIYRTSAWSTRVDLLVTDPDVVVEAARLLQIILDRIDAVASRFRSDSEVCRLQQSADGRTPTAVSADLSEAVAIALRRRG